MARTLLPALLALVLGTPSWVMAETKGTLQIQVTGLRSGEGKVAVSLFAKENQSAFPGEAQKAARTFYLDLSGAKEISVTAEELPYGEYAIALMHDENGNGKMDTKLFGITTEGFGFSNNPKVYFGPPSYQKCSFQVSEPELKIPVTVKYLL